MLALYVSHFLSAWGDRLWQFAVPILFLSIFTDTLAPAALFNLVETLSVAIFGAAVGSLVNRINRLRFVAIAILCENGAVALSALGVLSLSAVIPDGHSPYPNFSDWRVVLLIVLINFVGGVEALASVARKVAIEKDWVVEVAERQDEKLTRLNTIIRRIDLVCKICAPILLGVVTSLLGFIAGVWFVVLWNVISGIIEYGLLRYVYKTTPSLAPSTPTALPPLTESQVDVQLDDDDMPVPIAAPEKKKKQQQSMMIQLVVGWRVWARQSVMLASLSFTCLFFTVLSFGSVMTAFLKWGGMPDWSLAVARGVAATFGISATFAFPYLRRFGVSLVKLGLGAIWGQWITLLPCAIAALVVDPNNPTLLVLVLLIAGVCLSRLGLWLFDLSENQILQLIVIEEERGAVGAVQSSLSQFMEMATYAICIVFSDPRDFWWLVLISVGMVLLSSLIFTAWAFGSKGKAFVSSQVPLAMALTDVLDEQEALMGEDDELQDDAVEEGDLGDGLEFK